MRWPWRRKPRPPARHPLPGWPAGAAYPDSLSDDLYRHMIDSMYAVHPRERMQSHWVMTMDWLSECRKLAISIGERPPPVGCPDVLLGLPVEVREGSGPPHLEAP
jgi:hypothetical protein